MAGVDEVEEERRQRLLDALKREFFLPPLGEHGYRLLDVIGQGAYGVVCSAKNDITGEQVAVKRIMRIFDEVPEATRILRELKFLRLLGGHENIISIKDVLLPGNRENFNDVFVVFELMPTDLSHVLRSSIELSNEHIRWIMYQLFRGVHYLHCAKVFHRDLKPSNILLNAHCDLRICDFGLARAAVDQPRDMNFWTDYVATRWYRAPELIMTFFSYYSTAIDIWSVGCIFGEMLNNGAPLFPGLNGFQVLEYMVKIIGSPSPDAVQNVRNNKAKEYLLGLPPKEPTPFTSLFPNADPGACALLQRLLVFDPSKRPTAKECLEDPYFSDLHEIDTFPPVQSIPMSEFAFECAKLSREEIRALFTEEILRYHPHKRDDYLRPQNQQFSYQLASQAERFRHSMRDKEEGLAPTDRNHESLPNQEIVNMWPPPEQTDGPVGDSGLSMMVEAGTASAHETSTASEKGGEPNRNHISYITETQDERHSLVHLVFFLTLGNDHVVVNMEGVDEANGLQSK